MLQAQYADAVFDRTDGVRADWPDRWFHVRVSQTEPIVRIICEQKEECPATLFEQLLETVRRL